jgi:hypothetical protein
MVMDRNARDQLKRLLKDRLVELADDPATALPQVTALPSIDHIIREARAEALDEVKAIFKEAIIEATLERVIDSPGSTTRVPDAVSPEAGGANAERDDVTSPEESSRIESDAPAALAPAQEKTKDTEQLQREIEDIRNQITQNERRLDQMKSGEGEGAAAEAPTPPVTNGAGGSATPEEQGCGWYVYGIVEENGSEDLPEMPGVDPSFPVYTLPCSRSEAGGIRAVVSQVSLAEFGQQELEANLEDMQWVENKVYAHQTVVESLLDSHTLVPIRFCTIYRSEDRVQEMLARHYDRLVDNLTRLEGKQEWGVKLYCDQTLLSQQVEQVSDRVEAFKAKIEQESSGAAYFMKKKMEALIEEEVERLADDYAQRSHDRLSSHAEEVVINSLQDRQLTGREDTMVLNGAYLVNEQRLVDFRAALEDLQEDHGNLGFEYELTGPWPPYSFANIEEN